MLTENQEKIEKLIEQMKSHGDLVEIEYKISLDPKSLKLINSMPEQEQFIAQTIGIGIHEIFNINSTATITLEEIFYLWCSEQPKHSIQSGKGYIPATTWEIYNQIIALIKTKSDRNLTKITIDTLLFQLGLTKFYQDMKSGRLQTNAKKITNNVDQFLNYYHQTD
ncbi:MAG: hypothetical protein ACTSQY_00685 [Candidatus Odinarchaeia archaeon]